MSHAIAVAHVCDFTMECLQRISSSATGDHATARIETLLSLVYPHGTLPSLSVERR